jgi:hypothetical protein
MSERDDRPADESSREGVQDGAAGAGSFGAVSTEKPDSVMPQAPPDPTTGPD